MQRGGPGVETRRWQGARLSRSSATAIGAQRSQRRWIGAWTSCCISGRAPGAATICAERLPRQREQAAKPFFGCWIVLALFLILSSGLALLIRPDRYHRERLTEGAPGRPMPASPRPDR